MSNLKDKLVRLQLEYPQVTKRYSQNNEQDIIMSYLESNELTSGQLLDIGAFDGETLSNTRAIMLRFKHWKGVFVEPSSFSFVKLFELYKMQPKRAELVNLAVVLDQDSNTNPIIFHEAPNSAASSIVSSHGEIFNNEKNADGDTVNPRKIYVGGISLMESIRGFGTSFDFINVDIEGFSSKLVLQDSFNPRECNCKMLCVEVDMDSSERVGYDMPQVYRRKMDEKFINLGYRVIGSTWENQIYGLSS